MFSEKIESKVDVFEKNRISGASVLTKQLLDIFHDLFQEAALRDEYIKLAKRALSAHPQMASLYHLASEVVEFLDASELSSDYFSTLKDRYLQNERELILQAEPLIKDGMRLCTLSFSSTLLSLIDLLHQMNKRFEIVVLESRPGLEGALLAKELEKRGIKTDYIIDAALFSFLPSCDLAVLGADWIAADFFINKMGSGLISLATKQLDCPLLILATLDKFLMGGYEGSMQEGVNDDLLKGSFSHVQARNFLFEKTIFRGNEQIITEKGRVSPFKIEPFIHPVSFPEFFLSY